MYCVCALKRSINVSDSWIKKAIAPPNTPLLPSNMILDEFNKLGYQLIFVHKIHF